MKIAIASGKGGTGKTTLSVNLASYLNDVYKLNITLVDLDVEEPNSGLFLNGELQNSEYIYKAIPAWEESRCLFCQKCRSNCNFNAIALLPKKVLIFKELCHSCYACSELCPSNALPMTSTKIGIVNHYTINKNLTFIEGKLDIGQESAVPLIKDVKQKANQVSDNHELIIYDAPPGTSCPVIESISEVDHVILVTEPTPFGLHDLKLAVKTVKELGLEYSVVVNKYGIGNMDVFNYCNNNNIPVIGKIKQSKKAATLYSNGEMIYKNIPDVLKEMENIGKNLNIILNK